MKEFIAAIGRPRFHYFHVFLYQLVAVLLSKGLYWQTGVIWACGLVLSIALGATAKVIDDETKLKTRNN